MSAVEVLGKPEERECGLDEGLELWFGVLLCFLWEQILVGSRAYPVCCYSQRD